MNRPFKFAVGEYYHLYQRGNEKRKVFLDLGDHWRFLSALYLSNTTSSLQPSDFDPKDKLKIFSVPKKDTLLSIGAYCLMPNHFHLLVHEEHENGISKFMQKLVTSYSMYFNKKNQRTGALFEGPFRARQVGDDRYLRYLFAYIHLNPVKISDPEAWSGKRIKDPATAKNFLQQYRFSSLPFYSGEQRVEDTILTSGAFPEYFTETRDFTNLVDNWINFDDENLNIKVRP